jgi:agmatine deiminase
VAGAKNLRPREQSVPDGVLEGGQCGRRGGGFRKYLWKLELQEVVLFAAGTCMPADFERQSAILIGVNELLPHHPHVLTGLVSALIDRLPIIAVITGEEQRRDLLTTLCDWGLPAHRVQSVRSSAVGLWVRDYGPSFVKSEGRVCVLDAQYWYDPKRPDDDQFPSDLANLLGVDVREVPVIVEGGNLLSNGRGIAVSSTVMINRNAPRYTPNEVLKILSARYGFRSIACLPPLRAGKTDHSDMFATFTAPDTLVLGRYDAADDPTNAALLDRAAASLRGFDTGAGPLKIERIPMPPHRDGVWRTYTNVVYANDVVVVPSYAGVDERIEREALDTYRRLLPGREIVSVEATSLARTGGALRCVTLNIPHLGHPMAFDDGPAVSPDYESTPPEARPLRAGAFVTSQGWYGPRRSVLHMEV